MILRNRRWLGFIVIAMCLSFVLLAPGKASAASLPAHITNVHPYSAGGGGCASDIDGWMTACISENSIHQIVADGYITVGRGHAVCNVTISIDEAPWPSTYHNGCFGPGSHLYGPSTSVQFGGYQASMCGHLDSSNGSYDCVYSPWQYT